MNGEAGALPLVAAIVGPTACGKSQIALTAAESIGAEIISVDSMQVYRQMDVGTAKPSSLDRSRVVHHMIDVVDPTDEFSAHDFRQLAAEVIKDVCGRGRVPLLVGGTGMYFSALTSGATLGPADSATRKVLEERLAEDGLESLVAELRSRAPQTADLVDLANPRRVVRALEIQTILDSRRGDDRFDAYGDGPADLRTADIAGERCPYFVVGAGVTVPWSILTDRIARRCEGMLQSGLVGEVREIFRPIPGSPIDPEHPSPPSATAAQAVGYKEVAEAIANGNPPEAATRSMISRTRQLARRQRAWFRRDSRLAWFSAFEPCEMAGAVASYLAAGIHRHQQAIDVGRFDHISKPDPQEAMSNS